MNYAMRFLDMNFFFLFSLFFLFLLNLFSVFSLLRSGDIGADTRSKSSLVLTGQFVGRTYQWVCQLLLVTCEETKLLHLSLESIKQLIDVFFLSLLIMIEVKFIPRKVFSSFYLHFILTGTNYQGLALCHSYLQNKIFNRLLARTAWWGKPPKEAIMLESFQMMKSNVRMNISCWLTCNKIVDLVGHFNCDFQTCFLYLYCY